MWDDFTPFITGTGPTAIVLDPDGTPNNILDVALGGSVQVNWSFGGGGTVLLGPTTFTVNVYADPVGLGANALVGSALVAGSGPYTATMPISPPLAVGAYRLTTLITCTLGAFSVPIAGFVDGPIIQVRP